jgi:hypothetical protein
VETDMTEWKNLLEYERKAMLPAVAQWHGIQAVKAYRRKDYDAYVRHVRIADKLWKEIK